MFSAHFSDDEKTNQVRGGCVAVLSATIKKWIWVRSFIWFYLIFRKIFSKRWRLKTADSPVRVVEPDLQGVLDNDTVGVDARSLITAIQQYMFPALLCDAFWRISVQA